MLQLGKGGEGGVLQPSDPRGGRDPETDCDCQRLLVVEEQRWQLSPGTQPVAAAGTCHRLHRIAQGA
jgi:hypothetical protein